MKKAESSGGNASQVQMEPVENQIIVYQPNETVRLDVRWDIGDNGDDGDIGDDGDNGDDGEIGG